MIHSPQVGKNVLVRLILISIIITPSSANPDTNQNGGDLAQTNQNGGNVGQTNQNGGNVGQTNQNGGNAGQTNQNGGDAGQTGQNGGNAGQTGQNGGNAGQTNQNGGNAGQPNQNGGTGNNVPATTTKGKAKATSSMTNGVFNSFLCGAGYNYDLKSARCIFTATGQNTGIPGQAQSGPDPNLPETQTESSVEPLDYENLSKVDQDADGFFPLECGINYRYLHKDKICKAINIPKSAESEENAKLGSSSSEEDPKT